MKSLKRSLPNYSIMPNFVLKMKFVVKNLNNDFIDKLRERFVTI